LNAPWRRQQFRLRVTIDESGRLSIAAGPPHKAASVFTDGSLPLGIERDQPGAVTEGSGQLPTVAATPIVCAPVVWSLRG
jgi:hypothetical protein